MVGVSLMMLFQSANNRLRQTQEDAEEVKVIMLENMHKTEERSGKLEELDKRAQDLEEKVTPFIFNHCPLTQLLPMKLFSFFYFIPMCLC